MNIVETIRTHKLIVLASALGLLIIMLIISVIILLSGTKKPSVDPDEVMISIDPVIWTDSDLQYWYTIPDAEQMQKLHDINERQMNKLWESVP